MITQQFGEIRIEHYEGKGDEPKHNWKVFTTPGNIMLGYLHDCDGIGGVIGDEQFMSTLGEFEKVCKLAEEDLIRRSI